MSCVFLFGGSLYVSAFLRYPYYWCIRYKRIPCVVNVFHLLFRAARHFSETESVACSGEKGGRYLPAVARQTLHNQVMSSFIWYKKKKLICGDVLIHAHRQYDVFRCLFYFLKKAECGQYMMHSMTDLLWSQRPSQHSSIHFVVCVCVFEHRHAVKYTSFWLHLIVKLII